MPGIDKPLFVTDVTTNSICFATIFDGRKLVVIFQFDRILPNRTMTLVRMSPMQRQTAKLLSQSREKTVEVTVFGDLDATALIAFRKTIQGKEPAPSITHFILAALARALAKHPHFNAHFVD
ncbi:MAG: 2-oxo acid dehydrogenase subunit E2, partial [Pseudomonadota bacterium]